MYSTMGRPATISSSFEKQGVVVNRLIIKFWLKFFYLTFKFIN